MIMMHKSAALSHVPLLAPGSVTRAAIVFQPVRPANRTSPNHFAGTAAVIGPCDTAPPPIYSPPNLPKKCCFPFPTTDLAPKGRSSPSTYVLFSLPPSHTYAPIMDLLAVLSYSALSYLLVVLGLYAVSATVPTMHDLAGFLARLLTSWIAMCVCATYGVFASIFLRIIGEAGLSQWTVARSFKYTMWWSTGVTFDIIEGQEHLLTRPCVIVGNHQT